MRLLVPETLCHVQRCPRLSPERVVGIDGFRTIAARPRDAENPSRPTRPPHARRLQTTLTCKAKLRGDRQLKSPTRAGARPARPTRGYGLRLPGFFGGN